MTNTINYCQNIKLLHFNNFIIILAFNFHISKLILLDPYSALLLGCASVAFAQPRAHLQGSRVFNFGVVSPRRVAVPS